MVDTAKGSINGNCIMLSVRPCDSGWNITQFSPIDTFTFCKKSVMTKFFLENTHNKVKVPWLEMMPLVGQ